MLPALEPPVESVTARPVHEGHEKQGRPTAGVEAEREKDRQRERNPYRSGFRLPRSVGISSETVGWMCTVLLIAV